jgi:hypothetical protein
MSQNTQDMGNIKFCGRLLNLSHIGQKNVDNMGKLSFTPLSKHAFFRPVMELELGCQLFISNSCTEFLRESDGRCSCCCWVTGRRMDMLSI